LSDHSWLVVAIFSAQVSSNDWYSLANSPANGPGGREQHGNRSSDWEILGTGKQLMR